ncbi:polysaccharide deacetylase family protein [Leptospira langatensis]|uniref:Polysaccharide deacetylase family protein n=1 Tax=Leptospira langatensis TaxID=2484983 RepID=A0A5F1ZUP2_9LEPT|nr:polysaccharide deacetylase family protein [Leptospira langatensis]TGK00201.1 polysaccharide deacetylase family protein [Leptospira langatensis]TGL41169.1 polysaccharide deacetylase family protein [Leptospira langatensis]
MNAFVLAIASLILFFLQCTAADLRSDLHPSSNQYALGYYEGDPLPSKTAFLTFDDGPSDWTSEVLDVLKEENVKATFFVCGAWLPQKSRSGNSFQKYRDTLIRMRKEGHVVGNHTLGHPNLANMSEARIERQLDENERLYRKELGEYSEKLTLLRPPFGSPYNRNLSEEKKKRVSSVLQKKGIVFMWSKAFDSSDSKEWVRGEWYEKGPRINIESDRFRAKMDRIYMKLTSKTDGQGIVILFHDTHPTTKEVLPFVIEKLKEEGYKFGTAEDYAKWRWGKTTKEVLEE